MCLGIVMRYRLQALVFLIALSSNAADSPQVLFSRLWIGSNNVSPSAIAVDTAGNIFVAGITTVTDVPLVRPIQTRGFIFLTKLDPTGTNILYSTRLGSGFQDGFGGLAVDAAGNAYLTGTTSASDFPLVNAIQSQRRGPADAWVMKIDPAGQQILYSTLLGWSSVELGMAIAVDARGAAYVAGISDSPEIPFTDLLKPGNGNELFVAKLAPQGDRLMYLALIERVESSGLLKIGVSADEEAVVLRSPYLAKINAAGSRLVYESSIQNANSIAVEPGGFVWVAGSAASLPSITADAAQSQRGGAAYYRSTDGGTNWTAGADGLHGNSMTQVVTGPTGVLWAVADRHLFRSDDNGAHWKEITDDAFFFPTFGVSPFPPNEPAIVFRVVPDPNAPGTVYVIRSALDPLVKTTDGGKTWKALPLRSSIVALAVDPKTPGRLYAGGDRIYRSDDGGETWSEGTAQLTGQPLNSLTVDPSDPSVVYAGGSFNGVRFVVGGIFVSTDAGRTFAKKVELNGVNHIVCDPNTPGTAYAATSFILKTTDFGAHWTMLSLLSNPSGAVFASAAFDDTGALEVVDGNGQIYRSTDGGTTFTRLGGLQIYAVSTFAHVKGTLHLGGSSGLNAYITRLDNSGDRSYATFWGGRVSDAATSVALDRDGNVYVAGNTASPDFPVRNGIADFAGGVDAYLLKFSPDAKLLYSVTWGGASNDSVFAAAAGPAGQVVFGGLTSSRDFPLVNAPADTTAFGQSLFLTAIR